MTARWAEQLGTGRVVGIDLEDPKLRREWARRPRPNLEFRAMSGENLPFDEGEFDLAAATEVLEHVPDPERTVVRDGPCRRAATCSCRCRASRCGGR